MLLQSRLLNDTVQLAPDNQILFLNSAADPFVTVAARRIALDPHATGAIMQNVAVAIGDTGRGVRRTGTTDSAGQYLITGLPPAIYYVSVAMPGFESQLHKNLVLDVGETLIVDFHMKVSAGKEVVEVTSEPPVVDTARGSQAGVVEEQSIQQLPIDRRDYLTFSLLMPGVSNSNTIADNADF